MAVSIDKLNEATRLVRAGSLDEGEAICRSLLRNRPNHIEALQLLGGIQCRRSDFQDAVETFTKATKQQPRDAASFRNLGFTLASAGNPSAALEAYLRAAELSPGDAHVLNDLSMVLRQLGKLEEATDYLKKALAIDPNLIVPRRNLAEIQLLRGFVEEAIASFQETIRRAPNDAAAHNGLGNALAVACKSDEALAAYELAIEHDPKFAEAENNLATILRLAGRRDEAVGHCRRALELRPDVPETHERLGQALMVRGDIEEAILHSEAALKINPAHVDAINNIGSIMMDLGRFEESITYFNRVLSHEPNHALAYQHLGDLANQGHYSFSEEQVARIDALRDSDSLRLEERMFAQHSFARILEKEGRYVEAFAAFESANRMKQQTLESVGQAFKRTEHSRAIRDTTAAFSTGYFSANDRCGSESEIPVFVVGMPRSGTTLVEQIIASHPQAAGAGELQGIPEIVSEPVLSKGRQLPFPQSMIEISKEELARRANGYLARLQEIAPGADRVVDKMWGNFANLGVIAALFPRATIIHCRRDPMDICLSCFVSNFNTIQWACSLDDIAFYYREYESMMQHWRDTLPVTVLDVHYGQMVEEPERVSRELIEHCGLEWNDKCLEFYNNKSTVQTVSRVQVRQPIYKSSVGRWRRYEQQLKPLQQALDATSVDTSN